jgi:hypothetical protein
MKKYLKFAKREDMRKSLIRMKDGSVLFELKDVIELTEEELVEQKIKK